LRHRTGDEDSGKRNSQKKFLHGGLRDLSWRRMEQYAVASSLPIYHQSKPMKARVLLRFIAGLIEQALKAGPSDRKPAPRT
jgi:hypothetical protein